MFIKALSISVLIMFNLVVPALSNEDNINKLRENCLVANRQLVSNKSGNAQFYMINNNYAVCVMRTSNELRFWTSIRGYDFTMPTNTDILTCVQYMKNTQESNCNGMLSN